MKVDIILPDRTETFFIDADLAGLRLQSGDNKVICIIDSLAELFEDTDFPFAESIREIQLAENVHLILHGYSSPLFRDFAQFSGMVFAEVHNDCAGAIITV